MEKTEFEYLEEIPHSESETEQTVLKEIAYQLKRIADKLEDKKLPKK